MNHTPAQVMQLTARPQPPVKLGCEKSIKAGGV